MSKWLRLILLAVAAAVIAALFDRRRRREAPPPQWPDWSARRPPTTEVPDRDTARAAPAGATDTAAPTPTQSADTGTTTDTTAHSEPATPDTTAHSEPASGTGEGVTEEGGIRPVDGRCPDSHPVRAKESSRIYHLPGMLNYDRMRPDVCFATTEAAEAAGYRRSKV